MKPARPPLWRPAGSLRIVARILASLAIAVLLGIWGGPLGALFALGLAVGYLGQLLALAIGRRRG